MSTSVAIMRTVAILLLLGGTSFATRALTARDLNIVCPIGGASFRTTQVMSGTRSGTYLDLKPFGAIAAPSPIPKCPGNGFVIFKNLLTEEEIAQLKPYIAAAEYQMLQRTETNYFLAARLQRVINAPAADIAYTLLQATWEAKAGDQYNAYAIEALDAFKTVLKTPRTDSKTWLTEQLVAVELERRLGRFAEAGSRLSAISQSTDLATMPVLRAMSNVQVKLVAEQDARPAMVPATAR
jgi:hypothetical protein